MCLKVNWFLAKWLMTTLESKETSKLKNFWNRKLLTYIELLHLNDV